jgi:hypothetical protein
MNNPPALPEKDWFTLEEISERWKTDPETLRHWKQCGLLEFTFRTKTTPNPNPFDPKGRPLLMPLFNTFPVITREERDRFEAEHQMGAHGSGSPKVGADPRERRALLNIIGALVELIKSPRPGRDNDAAVIAELLENWQEKYGISERNLKAKFAEARRSLMDDE